MNRVFKREYIEEDLQRITETTKIGVFSFTKSAGSTFVATSLAQCLAEQKKKAVAFVELGKYSRNEPLLYDAIGMEQRFNSREFNSFFLEVKEHKYIKNLKNSDAGINWAVRTPKDREQDILLTPLEEARILNNICGDWIICDLGSRFNRESMEDMDVLIGVIDPLPSKLLATQASYLQMRAEEFGGRRLIWVINKYNSGVNNKLLRRSLKLKNPITLPLIPEEWFYVAQYHCRLPFEQAEIKKIARSPIEELVKHHILFT